MEEMRKLKEMLERELEEFARKEDIDPYDLETIHKLTDTIKNLDKIEMIEEGGYSEDGYSQARGGRGGGRSGGYSREGGGYSQDGGSSYAGGSSYGEGGGYSEARQRRDSRGRYSRDDGREQMMRQMEGMMSQAGSEHEREIIRRCMEQLRGA